MSEPGLINELEKQAALVKTLTAERDEYKMEAGICTATNKLLKDGFNSVCDQRDELVALLRRWDDWKVPRSTIAFVKIKPEKLDADTKRTLKKYKDVPDGR